MTAIETTFLERTPASAAHAATAAEVMPGGDTRAAGHHPPYQLTMVRGEGAHLTDLDGHRYIDLIGNFTSLCHGNAYAPIVEAATRAAAAGSNWPARNESAVELAETSKLPALQTARRAEQPEREIRELGKPAPAFDEDVLSP